MLLMKMEKISIFLLILLVFSVEMKVEAERCRLASVGCSSDAVCNQYCWSKYPNGHGECYRPAGFPIVQCACTYDC
ncbi:hypothetical protein AQUCO_01100555v1 [Aquilegia coerulea]|uniref:Knottin scorpion toxin-like domain-containing protein n=1 Tax=Aquilegia coerulea TaxID=218851 RepID=A0A2G5E7L5_AQUCA|nr:hypothetical protein AQUCO_01100555v1 [Aquilegia coerulea]